ncbi:DUF4296 domain-containing protein [Winogradskyella tangerina]|uniref:DUF4296 domain-containing protein n=1 Tax=Winogradskyella tangerina TaxID=2023240 RepID=UPI000DBE2A0D|nr:DUF4296 domain-containing protein [Winogradskyella tangerina]
MKSRYYIFLGLLFALLACQNESKPQKPDNLIPRDKMEEIIYDMYVLNSAKGINKKILERNNVIPETYILSRHDIDSLQFAESNDYYTFDSEEYKKMIESIKARLQKEKVEFEELQKKEGQAAKRRRDSINRANMERRRDTMKIPKDLPEID